jgi:hypothetical protein
MDDTSTRALDLRNAIHVSRQLDDYDPPVAPSIP